MKRGKIWLIATIGIILAIANCGCRRKPASSRTKPNTIREAIRNGDKTAVEEFIAQRGRINGRDRFGLTALHWAAWYGEIDIVKLLLSRGADIHAKCKEGGMTALHYAAAYGQKEVAELLITKGANVNAKNVYGVTPLASTAMGRGESRAVAELLIANGADINAKHRNGSTPLHDAVLNGQPAMVSFLLSAGANAKAKDNNGETPLGRAIILSETRFRRGSAFAKRKKAFKECVRILREYEAK